VVFTAVVQNKNLTVKDELNVMRAKPVGVRGVADQLNVGDIGEVVGAPTVRDLF
jgi:hypothetical protein